MHGEDKREQGFTLIELLIAIVVVGILTAVAIVGIAGLTNKGNASACASTIDAAKAATSVYYANNNGAYPTKFSDLTTPPAGQQPMLTLSSGVTPKSDTELDGNGWVVTMTPGSAGVAPSFAGTVNGETPPNNAC